MTQKDKTIDQCDRLKDLVEEMVKNNNVSSILAEVYMALERSKYRWHKVMAREVKKALVYDYIGAIDREEI